MSIKQILPVFLNKCSVLSKKRGVDECFNCYKTWITSVLDNLKYDVAGSNFNSEQIFKSNI